MKGVTSQRVEFEGPAGRIEGVVDVPSDRLPIAALVCHPHPLHGGTMTNKVAHTLARTLCRAGVPSLRFNFRGVGRSAGQHDGGVGELDDAIAAAEWLRSAQPHRELWVAGFSFGAHVALRAAPRLRSAGLITVAPPVTRIDASEAEPLCPWLIVHGEADELVPLQDVRDFAGGAAGAPLLVVVDGASHFFHGALGALAATVDEFFRATALNEDRAAAGPRT